ncbi:glycine cleavage system protein R [Candidatus Venteria ishoeyi]|uniref:Glycine cleavage system transcriptional repressor n=1 Tax=Candidatus Venteria ishoeyi TaxID=1899563 RepID=A0A1H6FHI7_9GAMM|nr:glycine cleavage system protein R [Candidatus Venteria ishoeyi]MDM8547658.1 glycine cleavage system protein R [Candidatus Venteria ishoeyi]SEH08464.1 Glycine cleavage system transcriptional repressor [Candidatus Venteria ishoeyi]
MQNLLVISALGDDRPGIVDELTQAVADCGCNVSESRMSVLGGEFAIILLLSGNWGAVAKLEAQLPKLQSQMGLLLTSKRTEQREFKRQMIAYEVEVVAMDHPGIVRDISGFFSSRQINIENLQTSNYAAAHTGAPMFAMQMNISIPADLSIGSLRGEFMDLCDELNLDAMLAPIK